MTKEEAIKELSYIADEMPSMECVEWLEAISMAIKALQQEPCDDAVSRKDVHDMLENLPVTVENHWFNWLQKACIRLAELPPVKPVEKVGHWTTKRTIMHDGEFYCDVCDNDAPFNKTFRFCPNCGAKMQEEVEE